MRDVFMFLFGALTGVTTFMVFICCIWQGEQKGSSRAERRTDDER